VLDKGTIHGGFMMSTRRVFDKLRKFLKGLGSKEAEQNLPDKLNQEKREDDKKTVLSKPSTESPTDETKIGPSFSIPTPQDETITVSSPPKKEESVKTHWEEGDVIDGLYRVWGKDESGGMGIVYFVEHLGWRKNLAVKTIRPEFLRDEKITKAFIREAETWINLGLYPNAVNCFYVRQMGGLLRIFTEYVDGGSLKKALSEGRIGDFRTILDLVIQFCHGMGYAHRKGLIHRDIKPANCLLTKDGALKITDFGLTKALGMVVPELGGLLISRVEEGSVSLLGGGAGTPEYMAPEQFEGRADFSSDIYSFGVMLYEMVCWRRPFVMPDGMNPSVRPYYYQRAHTQEIPPDPKSHTKAVRKINLALPISICEPFFRIAPSLKTFLPSIFTVPSWG